ncbi:unnamed protein product [Timema podura]|uniref:tryptophan--tRNA ligase n=1 Tax=Timema podura TaxID=61482 RepID=A0ABN7P7C4_TIMPD|nr:unnamed protein product [Timema podura]
MTATLLSCGINPDKSILFQQSRVSQHVELCWVLGSLTTMARLGHLPQFKEKSARLKEVPLGIFIYPVLQAADILLYKGTHVPVGEDQLQHLQLAQHLARTFNNRFGETFPVPKAIIGKDSIGRLKSLRDPLKKMSKSDADPRSRIELTDSSEAILDKCKKAITDFTSAVTFDPRERPGIANLITIHSMLSGINPEDICKESAHLDTGKYKLVVAKVVEDKLSPIREKICDLMSRPQYLEDVLEEGAEKASSIAELTWQDVKTKIGFKLS